MRLPLVVDDRSSETVVPARHIPAKMPSLALVPVDEVKTLEFASMVLFELARLSTQARVVIESTSSLATSLPSALSVHGASWSRISATDTDVLEATLAEGPPVLLIGTGLALAVDASLILAITGDRVSPMISKGLREVRPRLDGIVTGARAGLAARLARRLVARHP